MKKILIVGVDWFGNDPVSQIVKNAFLNFSTDSKIYFFGLGNKNDFGSSGNINYKTIKSPYFSALSFIYKAKRRIAKVINHDTFLNCSSYCYKRLSSFAKCIAPDLIVGVSGPMFYMESSARISKKLGIPVNEVFFDPCSNNPTTVNYKKRRKKELWWFACANNVFFDSANLIPNEKTKKIKTFSIPVNPTNCLFGQNSNILIYGGGFYKGFREPNKLADFCRIAKKNGYVLKAFVRGNYGKELLKESGAEVYDEISHDDYIKEISFAKAIVALGNTCEAKYSPSKIIDGINLKKPIITIDIDLNSIVSYPFAFDWNTKDLFGRIEAISIADLNNFNILEKNPNLSSSFFCNLITEIANL